MRRIAILLCLINAVLITGFWTLFFLAEARPLVEHACYEIHEHSFPPIDSLLVVVLLAAAWGLRRGRRWAISLLLPAAGAVIFLAGIDIAFNLLAGVFASSTQDLVLNALGNGFMALSGLWLVVTHLRFGDAAFR